MLEVPDAITADNKGLRYDEGKLEYHLIPTDGLRELAKVFTAGAKKYSPYNWERGMKWTKVYNSLRRHLDAFWDGEMRDPETGLHHMAHATWNALALLVYAIRGIGIDDRRATVFAHEERSLQKRTAEAQTAEEIAAQNRAAAASLGFGSLVHEPLEDGSCIEAPEGFALHLAHLEPVLKVGTLVLLRDGHPYEVQGMLTNSHWKARCLTVKNLEDPDRTAIISRLDVLCCLERTA
jgi:Domain of unknown function (DUF5664)